MAGVNVSREALTGVRASLNQFKTEIADVPFSMERNADMLQSECESAIQRVELQINQLNQQISRKDAELSRLQSDLGITKRQLTDTEVAMQKTEQALAGIESELKGCETEVSHLRAALSYCDENERAQLQLDVIMAEKRLSELQGHEYQAAREHQAQEQMIEKLKADIGRIHADIGYTENEIQALRTELSRKENKLDRLNMAYYSLKSSLNDFTNSVRRFSQHALEQTRQDIAGVNQCIQYIDDYLATNL